MAILHPATLDIVSNVLLANFQRHFTACHHCHVMIQGVSLRFPMRELFLLEQYNVLSYTPSELA